MPVFKTGAFNRSAIPPVAYIIPMRRSDSSRQGMPVYLCSGCCDYAQHDEGGGGVIPPQHDEGEMPPQHDEKGGVIPRVVAESIWNYAGGCIRQLRSGCCDPATTCRAGPAQHDEGAGCHSPRSMTMYSAAIRLSVPPQQQVQLYRLPLPVLPPEAFRKCQWQPVATGREGR